MYCVVWEFHVCPHAVGEFLGRYGSGGAWWLLFSKDPAFSGTELLRDGDDSTRFITIDRWQSAENYEHFLRANEVAYHELDAECEGLTTSETRIGAFTAVST